MSQIVKAALAGLVNDPSIEITRVEGSTKQGTFHFGEPPNTADVLNQLGYKWDGLSWVAPTPKALTGVTIKNGKVYEDDVCIGRVTRIERDAPTWGYNAATVTLELSAWKNNKSVPEAFIHEPA